MNKYIFDWQDVVHGQIEIDANSGIEAERAFREMSLEKRLVSSQTGSDKQTLHIKYVDNGIGDIHLANEWSDTWREIS